MLSQLTSVLGDTKNPQVTVQLEDLLENVTPGLLKMGDGARRLVLLSADDVASAGLQQRIQQLEGEAITAVKTSARQIFHCCEGEQISFDCVAARLMTSQPDCRELASSLHSRTDVL
jgi:hypothetical protein